MWLSLCQCVAQHLMVGIRGLRRALADVEEPSPHTHTPYHTHLLGIITDDVSGQQSEFSAEKQLRRCMLAVWRHLGTPKPHLHSSFWIVLRANKYCYDKEYAKSQRTLASLNGEDDRKTLYHFLSTFPVSY